MKVFDRNKICPKCQSPKMKDWHELNDEQQFLVERLPTSSRYTHTQRKKHRFCVQCFYEQTSSDRKV
jgi:hypothetical protein